MSSHKYDFKHLIIKPSLHIIPLPFNRKKKKKTNCRNTTTLLKALQSVTCYQALDKVIDGKRRKKWTRQMPQFFTRLAIITAWHWPFFLELSPVCHLMKGFDSVSGNDSCRRAWKQAPPAFLVLFLLCSWWTRPPGTADLFSEKKDRNRFV